MEVMSLKSFIGGIHPKDQKQYTKDLPIIKIKASDEVVFPLKTTYWCILSTNC